MKVIVAVAVEGKGVVGEAEHGSQAEAVEAVEDYVENLVREAERNDIRIGWSWVSDDRCEVGLHGVSGKRLEFVTKDMVALEIPLGQLCNLRVIYTIRGMPFETLLESLRTERPSLSEIEGVA